MNLKKLFAVIPLGLVLVSTVYSFQPAPQAAGAVATPMSDAALATQIRSALEQQPWLGSSGLTVKASSGRVRVSGAVNTLVQAELVEDITSRVQGVKDVTSQLLVRETAPVGNES